MLGSWSWGLLAWFISFKHYDRLAQCEKNLPWCSSFRLLKCSLAMKQLYFSDFWDERCDLVGLTPYGRFTLMQPVVQSYPHDSGMQFCYGPKNRRKFHNEQTRSQPNYFRWSLEPLRNYGMVRRFRDLILTKWRDANEIYVYKTANREFYEILRCTLTPMILIC